MSHPLIAAFDRLTIAELEAVRDAAQQHIKDLQQPTAEVGAAAPIGGSLVQEYTRCGKPNCRCARGQLHGPYWFRYIYRAGGGQRRIYIGKQKPAA